MQSEAWPSPGKEKKRGAALPASQRASQRCLRTFLFSSQRSPLPCLCSLLTSHRSLCIASVPEEALRKTPLSEIEHGVDVGWGERYVQIGAMNRRDMLPLEERPFSAKRHMANLNFVLKSWLKLEKEAPRQRSSTPCRSANSRKQDFSHFAHGCCKEKVAANHSPSLNTLLEAHLSCSAFALNVKRKRIG